MANKKKPYVKFETKEDYDKEFKRIFNEGKKQGFSDGTIWVLSYIQELLKDMFKPLAFEAAEDEICRRRIEKWRKEEEVKSLKEELDFKNFIEDTMKSLEDEWS